MKNILLICLLIVAIAMIFLGLKSEIIPPTLTGIGFIVIAAILYDKKEN